jgi:hypothetical protein
MLAEGVRARVLGSRSLRTSPGAAPGMARAWAFTAGSWKERRPCCTGSTPCAPNGRSTTTIHQAFVALAKPSSVGRRLLQKALIAVGPGSSHPGSEHVDLTARRGRVEAVLDQPANPQKASQGPPSPDHVEVDVGAIAGGDVAQVLLMAEREGGEVVQGIPLARQDQSMMPVISSP